MTWRAYAGVSRFDHWFKNVFAIPGTVLGAFAFPETLHQPHVIRSLIAGYLSLCFAASANYVINEVLDAPLDALHPDKRHRPVPSGQVRIPIAWALMLIYDAIALGLAALVDRRMLILTASVGEDQDDLLRRAGADAMLAKPFEVREFRATVRALLDGDG